MEWVETTARTVDEAKELALDQLGVVADDAEFEVLAEPKQGLFGRVRGEARVRARVRPTPVRPKQERRRGGRKAAAGAPVAGDTAAVTDEVGDDAADAPPARPPRSGGGGRSRGGRTPSSRPTATNGDDPTNDNPGGVAMTTEERAESEPSEADVASVRDAAVGFVGGLTTAFGFEADVTSSVEGSEIEVRVDGSSLGLLIGPGGRTLLAIQDLARVAAQRRLGDHDTRLRIDVAGYREKRRVALEKFAATVAEQVRESGVARSLDPMPSADRKVLHDALAAIDGVSSRSEGEDPYRRVVVVPA
jgi:spoIIIJ-associated protein